MVENGVYFDMNKVLIDPNLKNIGELIFSYLNFESLIEARMVSKTWYHYLEKLRKLLISSLRMRLDYLKEGTWCEYNRIYIDKKYPPMQVLFRANENYFKWETLSHEIEQYGSVADFINFIQRMEDSYDRKNKYCGNWEMKIIEATYEFEYSPLEAAICHGKYYRRDLKFLKMLKKHKFLHGTVNP